MAFFIHSRKAATPVTALAGLAFLAALAGCSTASNGSLDSRTLPEEKRYEFLKSRDSGVSPEVRNAFVDGRVIRGTPRDWVLELYGRPDGFQGDGWEYRDGKGKPILVFHFAEDIVDSIVSIIRSDPAHAGHPNAR